MGLISWIQDKREAKRLRVETERLREEAVDLIIGDARRKGIELYLNLMEEDGRDFLLGRGPFNPYTKTYANPPVSPLVDEMVGLMRTNQSFELEFFLCRHSLASLKEDNTEYPCLREVNPVVHRWEKNITLYGGVHKRISRPELSPHLPLEFEHSVGVTRDPEYEEKVREYRKACSEFDDEAKSLGKYFVPVGLDLTVQDAIDYGFPKEVTNYPCVIYVLGPNDPAWLQEQPWHKKIMGDHQNELMTWDTADYDSEYECPSCDGKGTHGSRWERTDCDDCSGDKNVTGDRYKELTKPREPVFPWDNRIYSSVVHSYNRLFEPPKHNCVYAKVNVK